MMHALLLLGFLTLQQAAAITPQPPVPASPLLARPASLPSYQLGARGGQQGPIEYSDAYAVRLEIHKIASYATIPLFVLQYIAGQQLLNGRGSDGFGRGFGEREREGAGGLAGWHGALASGIGALFAVNTITGGWNLIEARKDPEGRAWRTIHGVLMLVADAGFVATGISASEGSSVNTHRTLALSSMGVALVSYVMMLPPFRKE